VILVELPHSDKKPPITPSKQGPARGLFSGATLSTWSKELTPRACRIAAGIDLTQDTADKTG